MSPNDWSKKQLQELASVERGKFSARPRNDPQYYGGDIPFVQTGDVSAAGRKLKQFTQTLNEKGLKVSKLFPPGTILITIAANIGDVALTTFDVACPDSLVAIRPLNGTSVEWLLYKLQTKKEELDSCATQNAQKNINLEVLRPLQLDVPPLPEQKKIAEILSCWDKAIETTERLIEAKVKMKRGLLEQLLNEVSASRSCKVTSLINLSIDGINNGIFNNPKKVGSGCRLINVVNMYEGDRVSLEKLTLLEVNDKELNKYRVQKGDIFFTRSSLVLEGIAFCNINLSDQNDLVYDDHLMRIRPDSSTILPQFLNFFCRSWPARKYLMSHAKQTTMTTIGQKDIAGLPVPVPSFEDQKRVVRYLTTYETEIQLLNKLRDLMFSQKKGLMQQLLTGKVRVLPKEKEA